MTKKHIVCLTGESGSGKSVVAKYFEEKGYKNIDTFTTRKKRHRHETGHTFIEVKDKPKVIRKLFKEQKKEIAYIDFFHQEWYWSYKEQHPKDCHSLYAVNPNGIKSLLSHVTEQKVIVIYIKCDEHKRRDRMIERFKNKADFEENKKSYYDYIDQRITYESDEYLFVSCDYILNNNGDLNMTLKYADQLIDLIENIV